ncbi:MAG: DMT family transporter [Rhodocyclaceae bacterium]|nr:DMT family transporter [Rhodocyclaceae bacterium]
MSVPAAYLVIVLTWSTTPLAIQWSADGSSFAFALLARMTLSVALASLILLAWRRPLPMDARARRVYLVGGSSLLVAMGLTYWAAGHVRSGLISVLFGLSPLMTAVMAVSWLGEKGLDRRGVTGIGLAIAGLAVIFLQGEGGGDSLLGLAALLLAVTVHSANLVVIKRIGADTPPLATTLGTLLVALPGFALLWWLVDGHLPAALPTRAAASIVYLGVFGSVLGFALYFYVLKHLPASRVALITLMTPVLALLLGHAVNGEALEPRVWLGSAMILIGLALHQWDTLRRLWPRRRAAQAVP